MMFRYIVDFYSIDFDILKIDIFFSKAKLEMAIINVKQIFQNQKLATLEKLQSFVIFLSYLGKILILESNFFLSSLLCLILN